MKNPYFIDEPACISFSGGRTSAYMLYKILEAHGGKLPDDVNVCFANTGKEMPETLDFVQACADRWDVNIQWVESTGMQRDTTGAKVVLNRQYSLVDHKTASRHGEPFDIYMDNIPALPNPVSRSCTANLKFRGIMWLNKKNGLPKNNIQCIGIRADEKRRAIKIMGNPITEGQERYLPLYLAGATVKHVSDFWESQDFDLELPNNNGTTDWGNCDLCYLKSASKKMSIIRERPDLAEWWAETEDRKQQPFRRDHPSYRQMIIATSDQGQLFDFPDDETIPCFCGD